MEKATLPTHKSTPNFIGSWTIAPLSICDDLISYFESNRKEQKKGRTSDGIDLAVKNTTDIAIHPKDVNLPGNEVFEKYLSLLFECYQEYIAEWPFLATFLSNIEIGGFNLQRYESGQHFQKIHTERAGLNTLHRLFAWMTYLNDVDTKDGGSTYFDHFDLEVQPAKGLTLIWPAEWTHAHKGNLLKAGSKYIITGWMHFPHDSN